MLTPSCADARAALSAIADDEHPSPIDATAAHEHLAGCTGCQAFDADIAAVRQLLRFEPLGSVPDVAPAVLAALSGPRGRGRGTRPAWQAVAAAALVGAIGGASFVGLDRERSTVSAADLPRLVLAAQHDVQSLHAEIEIVDDGSRVYRGTLDYRAPETLAIVTTDETGSPLTVIADDNRWWAAASRRCVPPGDGPCGPPISRVVEHREPFSDAEPVPLELVAPVDALARAAPPTSLGTAIIGGRRAIGIAATAGQIAALLAGIDPLASLRPTHPTDPVELWLDTEHLVPLAVTVRAGDGPDRRRWAAAQGYRDEPGDALVAITLGGLRIDQPIADDAFTPTPAPTAPVTTSVDGGFTPGDAAVAPIPEHLPEGMQPQRSGTVSAGGPEVALRSWSDGRAWLVIRATDAWAASRLFGGLGRYVRAVDLGPAGVGYLSEDNSRIGIHTADVDLTVSGSLPVDELRDVAASLDVIGQPVPDDWAEAATATLAEATAVQPNLLAPRDLAGFGPPAVRIDGAVVTLSFGGPGERAFQLVRTDLTQLPPPLDPDVVGVVVRGTAGRYQASGGELEWMEDGVVHSLRSATLSGPELLAIADDLRRVR